MKKKLIFLLILSLFITINVQAETYDGEYSLDYLLRNYSLVTLGQGDTNFPERYGIGISKGNFYDIHNIEGAVLVNGDYYTNGNSFIGTNAGTIKSVITGTKGDNITAVSGLITDSNYIDFKKMYTEVMGESQAIADNTEYHMNGANLEVSKPGIYTIHNTALAKSGPNVQNFQNMNSLLIKNYTPNNYYIFNMYDEYVEWIPEIKIMQNGTANAISLIEYINSGNYTGNIIFNFPNAKFILVHGILNETIVAPKAFVAIRLYEINHSTIISNSISSLASYAYVYDSDEGMSVGKINMNIEKKLKYNNASYLTEIKDYQDDYYTRDYSISDLLQNYSLVTLGHKAIDSKSKLLQFGNNSGSVRLFHITGQALIAGDLYGKEYENEEDDYFSWHDEYGYTVYNRFDRSAFDLESNKVTESFIRGNIVKDVNASYSYSYGENGTFSNRMAMSVIQPWDNMANDNLEYFDKKNKLIVGEQNRDCRGGYGNYSVISNNYLNFDRLYDNVVSEQAAIKEGQALKVGEDGTVHIPIGGSYTIEDISSVKEVIFDNFDQEKDELTVITIKNSGDINFPLISKDTGSYKGIVTNDYYGKEQATHFYEQDTFVKDSYHGNIVWNVPNATYIKLKENAPFAGHLIAPKADVDTPELHFAGCFIVNSIYGEGNTEAHFYPITAKLKCDCEGYENLSESMKMKFSEYRLNKLLGGDASTIETTILGDEAQYREDNTTLENVYNECPSNNKLSGNPVVSILTNPKTYRNLRFIIVLGGLITYTIINKKKQKIEK